MIASRRTWKKGPLPAADSEEASQSPESGVVCSDACRTRTLMCILAMRFGGVSEDPV